MRIRTLIILALLFFLIGGLIGGGYAFFYHIGGDLKTVVSALPAPQTEEEKMIDEFIEEQEQKQNEEENPSEGEQDEPTDEENNKDNSEADKPKKEEPAEPEEQSKPDGATGNIGRPTVKDGSTLRVRSEPSTEGEVLIGIPNTEEVVINKKDGDWYNITTSNGTKGWVSADYIEVVQ